MSTGLSIESNGLYIVSLVIGCSCNFFLTNSIDRGWSLFIKRNIYLFFLLLIHGVIGSRMSWQRDEGDGVEMKCPIRVQENQDKCGTTNRDYWNWNPLKKLDRGTHQVANKPNKRRVNYVSDLINIWLNMFLVPINISIFSF